MSEITQNPPARFFKFQYGIRTDVGKKRSENQDSHGHAHTFATSVFLVADGMGGAKGGATASAIAVDSILKSVFTEDGGISEQSIAHALVQTNLVIFEQSKLSEDLQGMGTTAALLGLAGDRLLIGHVGDSRSYMLRDATLTRLTRDHTLVQELVESGAIGPAEAENHPIAHMLTRSLGPASAVDAEVRTYEETLRPGDTFLICCDGLYNLIPDDEIKEILQHNAPEQAADKFVETVLDRGASDNVTAIVFRTHLIDDSSVEFLIPEPGKLRLVLSRDVPALEQVEQLSEISSEPISIVETKDLAQTPPSDPISESVSDEPRADTKEVKKKHDPLEDIITTSDIKQLQEERAKRKEEKQATKDAEAEVEANALAETEKEEVEVDPAIIEEDEALKKLTMIGASIIFVAILVVSYFFLIRTDTRSAILASKPKENEAPTPTLSPTLAAIRSSTVVSTPAVVTPEPTLSAQLSSSSESSASSATPLAEEQLPVSVDRVDALLGEVSSLRSSSDSSNPLEGNSQPAISLNVVKSLDNLLSADENAAIDVIVSLDAPPEPKLKKDYLSDNSVQAIDWDREKTPTPIAQKLLSTTEKLEVSQKKTELRGILVENDIRLLALDSLGDSELATRSSSVEKRTKLLEDVLLKVDELLRSSQEEKKIWQRRLEQFNTSDPIRLATDVSQYSLAVAELKTELDGLQERYRETLGLWNKDRQNPELVSQTAALSRQIKISKTKVEVAVKTAIDATLVRINEVLVDSRFVKFQLEKILERFQRQVGFFKAVQPNSGGRNETRLKSLLQERRDSAKQLKQLISVFPDEEERRFLQDKFKSEL